MKAPLNTDRRTVIKTLGAGVVGGTVLTGRASAGDWNDERRQDSFTWAQNELYEMLDSEPEDHGQDDEGDEEAHRPLWVIDSMADTGVEGSDHSPHFAGMVDHVVPLVDFSAQWHVHGVVDSDQPFVDTDGDGKPDFPNFVNQDDSGTYLTSATRVRNASGVKILETPTVFTCPVRPHNHHP